MRRWRLVTGIVCGAGALALAGCATPGYNPGRVQSELVHAGTTRAQAQCVTDGLSNKIDEKQLGSHSAPSAITVPRAPTVSSTAPSTVTSTAASSAHTTTTTAPPSEYAITRQILASCGVKLPLQPPR